MSESHYFEFQAAWGLTKHMGGLEASRELIEACGISKDSYVLDVGSGVGITACILAEEYGCQVMGVDLSEMMVKRAQDRARRKKVEDLVEFRIGDAQALPFEDGVFDAVMCESVVAFPRDKQKVINEYTRVTKSEGFVGMNEVTWLGTPPRELAEYLSRALGRAEFLEANGWKHLLEKAGLEDIEARVYKTNALRQWASEVKLINPRDYLGAWGQLFTLFLKSPEVRKWIKEIALPPKSAFHLFKYFGYGLYTGGK
ncbi:MAG: methyltransferase domain-containing protein [Candidatus Aminicenantes bacterium]|nr:methyltransferase domain-containing protein [Candidatus Aminicenantes bacterium]